MDQDQHKFFSRAFYVLAAYFTHHAIKFGYSATRQDRNFEVGPFGELNHADGIILGLPLLFVGYLSMWAIAWRMRGSTKKEFMRPIPPLPDQEVPHTFWLKRSQNVLLFTLFYLLMFIPPAAMTLQAGKLNRRLEFVNLDSQIPQTPTSQKSYAQVLRGWNPSHSNHIFTAKNLGARWRIRTQDSEEKPGLSVTPFVIPVFWNLMSLVSWLCFFAFVGRDFVLYRRCLKAKHRKSARLSKSVPCGE